MKAAEVVERLALALVWVLAWLGALALCVWVVLSAATDRSKES